MKEQILDLEIPQDIFNEMKYSKQIVGILDFVILDIDLALREMCLHTVFFLVRIQSECGKIRRDFLDLIGQNLHGCFLRNSVGSLNKKINTM